MSASEGTKVLIDVAKVAFEAFFNNQKLIIDKKIKVYSSVIDYLKVECKSISINANIYNEKNTNVSSILFLALRLSATQQFNIKNFVGVFVPINDSKKHVAHYISNKLVVTDLNKTYTVNLSDDFAYQSCVCTESKIYIIPFVFDELSNVHIGNFSKICISFLTDDNKIITTELDCENTAKISGFINQRITIEEK